MKPKLRFPKMILGIIALADTNPTANTARFYRLPLGP
jgi:hypothetical protein